MRKIRESASWVLEAERALGAPDAWYEVECRACCQASDCHQDDPTPVELWALYHTAEHGLSHSQFVVRTDSYWAVVPRSAAESYGDAWRAGQHGRQAQDDGTLLLRPVPPRGSRAHARRKSRWRRWRGVVHGVVSAVTRRY